MTSVSRVNQVTNTTISGGTGASGDWDHRLNRLLEDLQESVIPTDSSSNEFREFRMTSSRRVNDGEPETTVDEKWVEYGTRNGGGAGETTSSTRRNFQDMSSSSSSSRMEKSVNFTDQHYTGAPKDPLGGPQQIQYLTPANQTTCLSSISNMSPGPSSPSFGGAGTSPKVEKKEFYSKSSYTQLIKGGDSFPPVEHFPPLGSSMSHHSTTGGHTTSESETRRERHFEEIMSPISTTSHREHHHDQHDHREHQQSHHQSMESKRSMFEKKISSSQSEPVPLYTPTPAIKSSQSSQYSSRNIQNTIQNLGTQAPPQVTPKPVEGLKTPPLVRKILQQSSKTTHDEYSKSGKPPMAIPAYDESSSKETKYYTATTTGTKHTQREMSPVRRFQQGPETPKHLEELLETFGETYDSRRYTGGDREHKSYRYGPGTQDVPTQRQVRIDENVRERRITTDESSYINPAYGGSESKNISGPPVYYPPGQQLFKGPEEPAKVGDIDVPDRKHKKDKGPKGDKEGGGAVPVPVCLPVCCAAPCSIM